MAYKKKILGTVTNTSHLFLIVTNLPDLQQAYFSDTIQHCVEGH